MAEKLGILASSDRHLDYVINLTDDANDKGKRDNQRKVFNDKSNGYPLISSGTLLGGR